jgi:DNA mismatch repair protein MutH
VTNRVDWGHPPASEFELLERAQCLARYTLGEMADRLGLRLPRDGSQAKGVVGQLVERALGATAENRPVPDFERFGIELKTVPVAGGVPRESTFVCSASLAELPRLEWPEGHLYAKTRRILWVPVEADDGLPLSVRRVGWPLLWSPDADIDRQLRADWETFQRALAQGEAALTAHLGRVVQLRPKAAHSRARTILADGSSALPRGFYFRRRFVRELFATHYESGG